MPNKSLVFTLGNHEFEISLKHWVLLHSFLHAIVQKKRYECEEKIKISTF